MICAVIERGGSTQQEIEAAAEQRGCWEGSTEQECKRKLESAKQLALELIQGNTQILVAADALMTAWIIALRGVVIILTAVGARPAAIPVQLVLTQAARFQTRISTRRAANDEAYRLVSGL